MRHFQREFPGFPANTLPAIIPAGFVDSSWHNDACPSLWDEARGLQIFCDHPEAAERECGEGAPRFSAIWDAPGGDHPADLFGAEEWGAVVDFLDDAAEGDIAAAARRARLRLNQLTADDARAFLREERAAPRSTPDFVAHLHGTLARRLCEVWAHRIGGGWHIDTPGDGYAPALPADWLATYDSDMGELMASAEAAGLDPYGIALEAIEKREAERKAYQAAFRERNGGREFAGHAPPPYAPADEGAEPCPVNRCPKEHCPAGCDHGETPGEYFPG